DLAGEKGIVVNDMTRDFSGLSGDSFQVVFDTFNDNRNGIAFRTNPKGARGDLQTGADGYSYNRDWDGFWFVQAKITDSGWQAEFAIPFKTLRFPGGESQLWGVNFGRCIRRKNEETYWSPIRRPYRLYRVSLAGTLEGINGVRQGRNLYIKPYISAPVLRRENDDVDFTPDAGLDVKYGVSSELTLDLTVNTEFSQVEADEQQINFTRFSLFFPEKREFFLENREIFEFGNVGFRGFSGRSGRSVRSSLFRPRNDLIPFFSRRIGISKRRLVPILGGARLTGRAGKYRLGIISMEADEFEETPSTNFTVARLRRDVFQNSDIGVLFVNKQESGGHFNRTYGVDANFRFFNYLDVSSYVLNKIPTLRKSRTKTGRLFSGSPGEIVCSIWKPLIYPSRTTSTPRWASCPARECGKAARRSAS
ncbi:carbohydrate binding family 9 domain-containing protein, partial [Acidobacteria bacterium AH-259-O06]|nr:carbohydrate binding family 9 domain-containing protein [Acidobacteria bacterium AH-259-O06]